MNLPNSDTSNLSLSTPTSTAGDVYAPPSATTEPITSTTFTNLDDSPWYSTSGRIGRIRHLAYAFIWYLVLVLLLALMITVNSMVVYVILFVPVVIAWVYLGIFVPRRRLHDLNRSGWFLLLNLVPVVNVLLVLYYTFFPGDAGFNDYGQPPQPYNKVQLGLAVAMPILSIISLIATTTLSLSAYEDYLEANYASQAGSIEDEVDTAIEARIAEIEAQKAAENNQGNAQNDDLNDAQMASDVHINADGSVEMAWSQQDEGTADAQNMDNINTDTMPANELSADDAVMMEQGMSMDQENLEIQAAIDEALGGAHDMSFEEFMNDDSQILVEE